MKKNKIFIYLCSAAIIIYGCDQKRKLQNVLTKGCYWDVLEKNSNHPVNSCYKFTGDGMCNFFYYNFYDKKKTDSIYLFDDDDVLVPNTWKLKNKLSIVIRGIEYDILDYNNDSIFLKNKSDTTILIKNCKSYRAKNRKSTN